MASPQNPNAQLNMLSRMPSPRGKSSLGFRGKDIDEFLSEYEHAAEHVDVLEGYVRGDWRHLKRELRSLYTSSAEKKSYQQASVPGNYCES